MIYTHGSNHGACGTPEKEAPMTAVFTGVALALASAVLYGQSPPTVSPQDCVKQGRDFATKRQQELRPLTGEIVRQIDAERVKVLKECGSSFNVDQIALDQLAALVEFYQESQQPDVAERALARGLAAPNLAPAVRGELLVNGVRLALRQRPKPDYTKAEGYADAIDKLPEDAFEQQLLAHNALNNYYRGDDVDAGIIKHATWMIEAAKKASPELRKKHGSNFTSGYKNLAEALASLGQNDKALDLLRRAATELADVPSVKDRIAPVLARYELVGKPAAEVATRVWLNRDEPSQAITLNGKVTLLQFTAHWCGPCKESYPGMKRLQERFKDKGFQVVFYTRTYGYFESERNLTAEQEIERDKKYFAGYGFTHPIAIGWPSFTIVDGKPVYQKDPVEESYGVGGIPQINVIDAEGSLRLIMIGYDDANEEKLATFIEGLLKKT
jgi:thiol-disulfide isomerase/thioredoxin